MNSLWKLRFKNNMSFEESMDANYYVTFMHYVNEGLDLKSMIPRYDNIRDLFFDLPWTQDGKKSFDNEIMLYNLKPQVVDFPPNVVCPRCSNTTGYMKIKQTRAGDEGSTTFYTCAKCGFNWRRS